jgi:hypothetical protein
MFAAINRRWSGSSISVFTPPTTKVSRIIVVTAMRSGKCAAYSSQSFQLALEMP